MPWRPRYPCTRCGRLTGCACARTSPRNHGGVSAAARGYGAAHQARRAALAEDVGAGIVDCARCRKPILPGEAWDLGHSDDRMSTAPEHARCNRAAPRLVRQIANNGETHTSLDRDAAFGARPHFETTGSGR